jgi:hypothetical protein
LHAECHFVLRDARGGFGITKFGFGFAIELREGIERGASDIAIDSCGIAQIEHGITRGSALHALIDGGQVA